MAKENKNCPSYDEGICVTHPEHYEVRCKDTTYLWHNIREFNKAKKEIFGRKK